MPRYTLDDAQRLAGEQQFAAYAALDVTGTREVYDVLRPRLNADQLRTYQWSKAQLSPAFAMSARGILVDTKAQQATLREVTAEIATKVEEIQADPLVAQYWDGTELQTGDCSGREKWDAIKGKCTDGKAHKWPKDWKTALTARCAKCDAPRWAKREGPLKHKWPKGVEPLEMKCEACGTPRLKRKPFSPTSHPACHHLFYNRLLAPKVVGKDKTVTTDDDALEKIGRDGVVFISQHFADDLDSDAVTGRTKRKRKLPGLLELTAKVRAIRDLAKQRGFLDCALSPAKRFHCSFNVAAPWTGRWSSSSDAFQLGSNAQNITERFRHIFVADPGRRMCYADLKTAESLVVAYLAGCESYIEAHKGDVHTYVCRLAWPELPWTGDIKADKKVATSHLVPWNPVPGHDYRLYAKRLQHGSNYGLSPYGMAMIAKIPVAHAKIAQGKYFEAFPEIREWQEYQRERTEASLPLYNALQRVVRLFGRPKDGHTYKQGLAFPPQSGVGDILNAGLWRVWRHCDPHLIELLAQVHDAILCQFRRDHEAEALAALVEHMTVPHVVEDIRGVKRVCTIQVEVAVGDNWGKAGPGNPGGLVEVK